MEWTLADRYHPAGRVVADRHYNRQTIGAPQFVPPGRCLVLLAPGPALWVTSWPLPEYVRHAWPGAWVCSTFRREGGDVVASELIRQAIAATRWRWPDVPEEGMVTFVNAEKVQSSNPGYCYLQAGFRRVGHTKRDGLVALHLPPEEMPDACAPLNGQESLL